MTTRIFQFNPLLYRVCNHATWERLEQMDGEEVQVSLPFEHNILQTYPEQHQRAICNYATARFVDGHTVTLLVFNSELAPLPESVDPGQTA